MLQIHWVEIFMRCIPETFLMILGIDIVTRQPINVKKYINSSIVMAIAIYCIRLLPIYFGVHMIICIILLVSVIVITGTPLIKAIYGVLAMYFMLSISEFLNLLLLNYLNVDANFADRNTIEKSLLGFPSLIILALFILVVYYLLKMKEVKKNA